MCPACSFPKNQETKSLAILRPCVVANLVIQVGAEAGLKERNSCHSAIRHPTVLQFGDWPNAVRGMVLGQCCALLRSCRGLARGKFYTVLSSIFFQRQVQHQFAECLWIKLGNIHTQADNAEDLMLVDSTGSLHEACNSGLSRQ